MNNYYTTRHDVENDCYVNLTGFAPDLTRDQANAVANTVIETAHTVGLTYGDDWSEIWESMTEDLLTKIISAH